MPSRVFRWLICALWTATTLMAFPDRVLSLEDVFLGTDGDDTRIIGRDLRDNAGAALAVGDISGDGIGDVLIGTPRSDGINNGERDAGEVALILGAANLPTTMIIADAIRTFYGATDSANLGNAVAVGDVDGDHVGDIIMGAPKADGQQQGGAGAVYVFYGGARLPLMKAVDLETVAPGITLYGSQDAGRFGAYLAAGDFNGDDFDDFAIAAPQEGKQFDRFKAGVVYVFFGASGLEPNLEITFATTPPFTIFLTTILGPHPDARAGRALAAGDVNGDGVDDLLIGVTAGAASGEVHVLFGGGTRLEPREDDPVDVDLATPDGPDEPQWDLRIVGPPADDGFGRALGVADINGDGTQDILIGAPSSTFAPGIATGRAYAIFGRPFEQGTVRNVCNRAIDCVPGKPEICNDGIDNDCDGAVDRTDTHCGGPGCTDADVTLVGPHDGAGLGTSVSGGDLNDDGLDEWIVGSPGADRFGQAYRILGRTTWSPAGAVGSLTQGTRLGDDAGAVTVVGDVSDDGIGDLILASPLFDGQPLTTQTRDAGAIYIVRGSQQAYEPSPDCADDDGDGFRGQGRTCGPIDCDDEDPTIQWRVDPEICTDCDGFASFDTEDTDRDGWPMKADSICIIPDCDDTDRAVNPAQTEVCNDGIDNDCNGAIDGADSTCCVPGKPEICTDGIDNDCDGAIDGTDTDCGGPGCTDADSDGSYVMGGPCRPFDCDDTRSAVNPGALELCDDGIDNDCDGATDGIDTECGGPGCTDADGDASCVPADCDDTNPAANPATAEICNDGIDNDCDGATDGTDANCGGPGCDGDGDGICPPADCDDTDAGVSPRRPEICDDGIDNDCDGATDGTDTKCGGPGCDGDGDGICPPADCDDTHADVNAWRPEICDDEIDNDCDGATDGLDTQCDEPPTPEVCNNCVDDNSNGLGDLLDPACAPTTLRLKALVAGHVRESPIIVKRVRVRTAVADTTLLSDTSSTTAGLTVGLAFDDGTQFCLPLDQIKRSRKLKLVLGNGSQPKGKLLLKQVPEGYLKVQYKQKGKLELSSGTAGKIAFGIYGTNHSYRGVAALRTKNAKTLATVKVTE